MALAEEHTSQSSLLSCAVIMTRYSAGHSDRRSPLCCWIRITWNTWSTPSGLTRAAPPSRDQEEKPTSPVDVQCSVPLLNLTIMRIFGMTRCFWRSLSIHLICKILDAFLWDDLYLYQWSKITLIVVHKNWWIHSDQGFIRSFDASGSSDLGSLTLIRIIPKELRPLFGC